MNKQTMANVGIVVIAIFLLVVNLIVLVKTNLLARHVREVQVELQRELGEIKGKVGNIEATVDKLDTMQTLRLK